MMHSKMPMVKIKEPKRSTALNIISIIDELPKHPYERWNRRPLSQIDRIIIHHSNGWRKAKPIDTADLHIKKDWAGNAYHYEVPYFVPRSESTTTCFQLNALDSWTYHTGQGWNEHGIGILVRGGFHSRHEADEKWTQPGPSAQQIYTLDRLVRYLMHELNVKKLYGHCHAGKPACPGDVLEKWIEDFKR